MNLSTDTVRQILHLMLGRVVRPNKNGRRDGGKLFQQEPRFRQVIEQAAAEDRVELSERGEIGGLEVRLDEFDVPKLEKSPDESRFAQIRFAAFQRDHALDPRVLRQNKTLRAFERAEFQNALWVRRKIEEPLHSLVSDCADPAAVGLAVDLELVNPRAKLRESFDEIVGRIHRPGIISRRTPLKYSVSGRVGRTG